MRYLAFVSYDGSNYHGFQKQENVFTIQQKIENAFKNMTQQVVPIVSSGRTDKGVHAKRHPFHFDFPYDIEEKTFIEGLNKRLPLDIRIVSLKKVSDTFHARYRVKKKKYTYVIAKHPSTAFTQRYEVYVKNFDIEKAKEATTKLVGTHDYIAFTKLTKGKETVRTVDSIVVRETSKHYQFIFTGKSFLRYMVRSMMGVIIDIATHKKEIDIIDRLFNEKNRLLASKTAEARGLFLTNVYYKGVK